MKYALLVLLLISNTLWSQRIEWKENKKLVWSNFKSKINNQRGKDIVAYTHCGWAYSVIKSSNPKDDAKVTIETIFNEDKSWKDDKRINDYVLNHEQKHFDIAEIFARKIRKEIAEKIKTTSDYDKYFQTLYNRIVKDYKNFQALYDGVTEHGMNKEKQAEYDTLISNELEQLKNFQKP
jgi:predicted secreted Zn-dependent protease